MPKTKYKVEIPITTFLTMEVEADSKKEAIEKAVKSNKIIGLKKEDYRFIKVSKG